MQLRKIAATVTRWLAAIGITMVTTQPSTADVLYTYQTSVLNLLYETGGITYKSKPDYFNITFLSPFVLASNSYYNISVSNSVNYIGSWSASDSLFGIYLTGSNAPISLVPSPGLMAGGALTYCEVTMLSCFGGAIATNAAGQIDQWNLVADGAYDQPYLTFITYNNPYIGTIDALGSTHDGRDELWSNRLGGPAGSWNGFTPSSYPPYPAVPQSSTWAMMLIGFVGLGVVRYQRSERRRNY